MLLKKKTIVEMILSVELCNEYGYAIQAQTSCFETGFNSFSFV